MNLNEYQAAALSTKLPTPFYYAVLKLCGEAGEVAEKVGKIIRDKDGVFTDDDKRELAKELGDVLWYVASFADELGYSLDTVGQMNVDKLASRAARGVIAGSGDNR